MVKGDPSVRSELVRRPIAELRRVSKEIAEIKARLREALADSGTTLTEVPGIGPLIAAKILGEVGDVDRIRSQAAFAMK